MKQIVTGSLGVLLVLNAWAFGEVGRWSSGWGQGVSEYKAAVSNNTALSIACSEDSPVQMTLTVQGKDYGSGRPKGFDLIIDGTEIMTPYDTGSRVGANNFLFAWEGMRKAKRLVARTADGKSVELPVKGVAQALPKSGGKGFPCRTEF
jgi:hypothetical protein